MAYTPMLEASKFLDDAEFKTQFFQTHKEDKPLVRTSAATTLDRRCRM